MVVLTILLDDAVRLGLNAHCLVIPALTFMPRWDFVYIAFYYGLDGFRLELDDADRRRRALR